MKTSMIIAAAAVSLLAVASAQAESYEGVQPRVSANSRADVRATAVDAAHSDNPYGDAVSSHVAPLQISSIARTTVRNDAIGAAHSANPYAEGFGQGVTTASSGVLDRASVRAQALAAAHGQQLAL